ncbi:MAG: Cys-tRNA(Pro) deacylase [Oscillospiraceae bacterium]|nr:Cys-tRNA(Pro) deacylase [Oscillospiraceae bacterium]
MNKSNKTNAMRLMDAAKIPYRAVEYEYDESDLGGEHVAAVTGMNPDQVFKTLVARGDKKGILVFCIPVSCTLDLKKAAHAAGDKKVEMIHMKELLGLTGYIRGGCSPVGMKKKYPTFMDETAALYDEIAISGGARGLQMVLDPQQLMEYAEITAADLVEY